MREVTFFNANIAKWEEMENVLSTKNAVSPDELSDLYVQLTDDLAYAQTHYPKSKTSLYLNELATRVHQQIYRNKKESTGRIKYFWQIEFPLLMYQHRKQMLTSLIVFSIACLIGAFSAAKDENFIRLILGDSYVDQTIDNIASGNPLGIYESTDSLSMFLRITINNVRVSFTVFAAGILFSIASGVALFYNGIMLGSFQYFFYSQGLIYISALTIWVHGTLEITAIVVAGGAGIALGNSFMFPGTHSRLYAFQKGARDSVKIIIGLIPIFIIAGFLEGFVTRYSRISTVPAAIIIVLSILFVAYYLIYYPFQLHKKHKDV